MSGPTAKVLLVGDLVLDQPGASKYFESSRDVLRAADLLIGHVEIPHTNRESKTDTAVPAHGGDPANLDALAQAGFGVVTLAGNHIFDAGEAGITDTLDKLRSLGIKTTGAGRGLTEARLPACVDCNGLRFGVLAYNTIGPRESWAGSKKSGCNYVEIITHYELDYAGPGGPPGRTYSFAEPTSMRSMREDVLRLRESVDVLIVAFHKGIVHTPVTLAMYERPLAEAAIDAGADIVVGHHAHILKGVETYKGRPIFHGLGNFVTVTHQLSIDPSANPSPERLVWAKRRKQLFNFEPDPDYPLYPFHPEAKNSMIAVCEVGANGVVQAGFLPCYVKPSGEPEVLANCERGREVAAYVERISREAELTTRFSWNGDRVDFR